MNTKIFSVGFLLLCWWGSIGWAASPFDEETPVKEYAAFLQEQADLFSGRLSGAGQEQDLLAAEYRRWADRTLDEVLSGWEERMTDAARREGTEPVLERALPEIEKQKRLYRRQSEQLAELFIRRYLTSDAGTEPGFSSVGYDSTGRSIEEFDRMLRMQIDGVEGPRSISEWQKAEESLLTERMEWEKGVEQQYSRELARMKEEYQGVLLEEERWEQQFMEEFLAERENREEQLVLFESGTEQDLANLAAQLSAENEAILEMDQKLAGSMNAAESLIQKAREQIFLKNDYRYWRTVERDNLELYEESFDTMAALRADLTGPIDGIEKDLRVNAELRLDMAQQERRHLEAMIEYLSLPLSNRPGRESLESRLMEKRDAFLEAREQYGPYSGQAGEAYDGLLRTGMMIDLADQGGRELLPELEKQLQEIISKEKRYAADRLNLRQDLSRILETVRNDKEVVGLRESFSEVKILREIDTALVQAAELAESKENILHQKNMELSGEIDREIKSLLSSGDLDTDILYPLVDELKERVRRKDIELLQDFAFALYHEEGVSLDPGYISSNQVYQKLKGKLNFSEGDGLDEIAAEAFAGIQANDELKELYEIYSSILATTEPGTSVIHRGMTEDLGDVLFDSVIKAADKKVGSLDKQRNTVLSHAAYNSGLAAISYGYFNVVAGAAFTAIAAGFYKEAADLKKEMDDIDSLRDSLAEQEMSGRDERYALSTGSNRVVSIQDRRQEVLREYELFTSREHTAVQWTEKLAEGTGDLNGILGRSARGLDGLGLDGETIRERFGQLTNNEGGTMTLVEFLDLARKENEILLGRREAENRTLLEEAEQTVVGLQGTVLPGTPKEVLKTYLKAATLVEVAASEAGSKGTEQLVRSRILRAGVELSSLKKQAGYIYDKMETRYSQWLGQKDYLLQTGRTAWNNRKEDLRSSVSEWDLSFREEYHRAESMWDRRSLQMEEFRREGLRQLSEEGAQRVVKEGMTRLQLTPANYAARSTLVDFTSLPRWSTPVHTQTPVMSSRESLDLFSALDGEEPVEELLPELSHFQERYGKYVSSIDVLYGRAEEMVQEVTYETGLTEMGRIVRLHQEDLLSSIDRANARIAGSLHTTLQAAGYRKNGNVFRRNALVDLTFFKHEMEAQSIRAYREYSMENPGWDLQLESLITRGNTASVNQSRYSELLEEIEKQRQIVFGEYEGDGSDPVGYVSTRTGDLFLHAREEFQNSAGFSDHEDMKGLLSWHIGYVPEMDEDDPQQVLREGVGEVGRIMTDYFINEARLGRGLSMMDTAAWDRRLWDDDRNNDGESDGLVKAATVRSLSDLGMQVASTLFLPPGAGSIVAGLADDLFFAVADTMGGYADAGDTFLKFGKKAVLQAAMAGNSSLWGGTSQMPAGWSDGVGLFEGVVPAIGTSAGNTLLSSSAAALDMEDGKISWSNERFGDSLLDKKSQFSLASSLTGTLGSNLMENNLFNRESLYGFSSEDIGTMRGSVQYGGELLNAAAEYAYTGSTSFNLAGIGGTGLLELSIDGKDLQWAVESGGTRISLEKINTLIGGFNEFSLRREISRYGDSHFDASEDGELAEQVLRFLHSFGDEQADLTLEALLADERGLGFIDQSDYRGVTLANGEGGHITSYLSNQGANSMLPASYAVTLQHEGYRDGLIGSGNTGETLDAVLGHVGMAGRIVQDNLYGGEALYGDTRIFRDMAFMGSSAPAEALLGIYSSAGDYWKIDKHGDVLWDGSHHLWGEGGHMVASHERGSFSRDLADYLGIDQGDALKMMEDVGLIYDPGLGTYVQTGDAASINATPALTALCDMERRFNPQQDGVLPVDRDLAYAWALKEHEYRLLSGDYPGEGYSEAVEAILESPDDFSGITGLYGGVEFTGINETATLYHYSQQRLEERVTGMPLDTARGDGYCLAESIAFNYVDQVDGVNWEDVEHAFETAEWKGGFDPYSGYVADKGAFTRGLSDVLGLEIEAREYRFSSMDDLNTYLYENSPASGNYHMVADYGSHFTHVRPDGLEVNTYPGWTPPVEGPEEWRIYIWDSE